MPLKPAYSNPIVGAFAFPCEERKNGIFEDAFLIDGKRPILAVADGYTQLVYTEEELKKKTSKAEEAAKSACLTMIKKVDSKKTHPAYRAMLAANERIYRLNKEYGIKDPDFWTSDYACTYGAVVSLDTPGVMDYAYISDCFVAVLGKDKEWKMPMNDDLVPVHDFWKNIEGEAYQEYVTRALIRNKTGLKDAQGRELGYGTLTGEPVAREFIHFGNLKAEQGDVILLGSDGSMPFLEEKEFLDLLSGPDEKIADFMLNRKDRDGKLDRRFGKERTLLVARVVA